MVNITAMRVFIIINVWWVSGYKLRLLWERDRFLRLIYVQLVNRIEKLRVAFSHINDFTVMVGV